MVVGHKHEPPGGVNAHESRAGAPGANCVECLKLSVGPINGEGTYGALLVLPLSVRLVGGVHAGAGSVHGQAARTRAQGMLARGCQRSCGAIHPEEVNAVTVARWKIHLSRQGIAERRTVRADIGEERSCDRFFLRRNEAAPERGGSCKHGGCLDKRTTGRVERNHGETCRGAGSLNENTTNRQACSTG